MTASIWDHFAIVPDPRIERIKKHRLQDILAITICAVICGAEHWTHIEEFAKANEQWFRTFLGLPHGIPSHDTFGRVFTALDPDAFEQAFQQWVHDLAGSSSGKHIAIDGKTLRRSFDRASAKSGIHMVSAWVYENHAVFGQLRVDDKSNEITAIPKLLEMLQLTQATVTIDAMGCQKDIAKQIVDKQGHYVLGLKANQQGLYEDVKTYLDDGIRNGFVGEHDYYETLEKGHGRIETRRTCSTSEVGWLQGRHDWPALSSITAVECERNLEGQRTVERRYFISSHSGRCAQRLGVLIRNHWRVETQLHWSLDVSFDEDSSRVRVDNAAQNLSRVRRIALMLLKQENSAKVGVKGRRLKAGGTEITYSKSYVFRCDCPEKWSLAC
jgi:predicted transposase YbfD/YdcC